MSLEPLGIEELEERAYRTLLAHRMVTVEDIAGILSLPPRKVQRVLDSIEGKGLATHSPERPRRYIATPPELAIEALVSQRQAVLERVRLTIPELREQASNSTGPHDREQVVEVITNRAALGQILSQLRQTIQSEAFGFQCAPLLYPGLINKQEMRPGVRIRSVSDMGYLALPDALETLRLDMQMGEEARVFPILPIKMFVVDRRIGIIPLNTGDQGGPTLLVRASSLLDALCSLFELIWERATPITFTRNGSPEVGKSAPRLSEPVAELLPLLASGLNDKAIAYEVGISEATLTRRVAELMKCFNTRTRFQLGWHAALDAYPHGLQGRSPDATVLTSASDVAATMPD